MFVAVVLSDCWIKFGFLNMKSTLVAVSALTQKCSYNLTSGIQVNVKQFLFDQQIQFEAPRFTIQLYEHSMRDNKTFGDLSPSLKNAIYATVDIMTNAGDPLATINCIVLGWVFYTIVVAVVIVILIIGFVVSKKRHTARQQKQKRIAIRSNKSVQRFYDAEQKKPIAQQMGLATSADVDRVVELNQTGNAQGRALNDDEILFETPKEKRTLKRQMTDQWV